jgi:hypothetical protein
MGSLMRPSVRFEAKGMGRRANGTRQASVSKHVFLVGEDKRSPERITFDSLINSDYALCDNFSRQSKNWHEWCYRCQIAWHNTAFLLVR